MSNAIAKFLLKRKLKGQQRDKRLLRSILKSTSSERKRISKRKKGNQDFLRQNLADLNSAKTLRTNLNRKQPSLHERRLRKRRERLKKEKASIKKDMKNLRNIQKQTYRTSRTIRKAAPWAAGGVGLAAANRWRKRRRKRDRKGRFR